MKICRSSWRYIALSRSGNKPLDRGLWSSLFKFYPNPAHLIIRLVNSKRAKCILKKKTKSAMKHKIDTFELIILFYFSIMFG